MILKDKVALVTGAAQGIGRAIALKLADSGADVVIVDMNLDKAQETAREAERLGRRALALRANIANLQEAEAMQMRQLQNSGRSISWLTMRVSQGMPLSCE